MRESERTVVDCLIVLEGENPSFFSYMNHDSALELQELGLQNAESINLRETDDRPVPRALKEGETCIMDILVKMEPGFTHSLN